jgi:hypothetical protein
MAKIVTGRHTDGYDGPLVVFLIGMRVNAPWRVDAWLPVFLAMPRMLAELHRATSLAAAGKGVDPGFLDHRLLFGPGGPTVVQYWRSVEQLNEYAAARDQAHRPAWSAFNARARRARGAVGIWHETYSVPAEGHETIYVDLPPLGLGRATSLVPVGTRAETARGRMGSRVR